MTEPTETNHSETPATSSASCGRSSTVGQISCRRRLDCGGDSHFRNLVSNASFPGCHARHQQFASAGADAVPDLSPEEIETSVTRPIELEMFGLPGLEQVRSLTRFGVSQVCLIFADGTDLYQARQLVTERLAGAAGKFRRDFCQNWLRPVRAWAKSSLMRSPSRQQCELKNSSEARLRRLKLVQESWSSPV